MIFITVTRNQKKFELRRGKPFTLQVQGIRKALGKEVLWASEATPGTGKLSETP